MDNSFLKILKNITWIITIELVEIATPLIGFYNIYVYNNSILMHIFIIVNCVWIIFFHT